MLLLNGLACFSQDEYALLITAAAHKQQVSCAVDRNNSEELVHEVKEFLPNFF